MTTTKPINRKELKPIFGSYKTFYNICGRYTDSYLLKVGIWDEEGNITGRTPGNRYSNISLLITAHVIHFGTSKPIPRHWIAYAKAQKED